MPGEDIKIGDLIPITASEARAAVQEGYIPYVDPSEPSEDDQTKRMLRSQLMRMGNYYEEITVSDLSYTLLPSHQLKFIRMTGSGAKTLIIPDTVGFELGLAVFILNHAASGDITIQFSGSTGYAASQTIGKNLCGTVVPRASNSWTAIMPGNGSSGGGSSDTTAPTIVSVAVATANRIDVTFSENIVNTTGFTFTRGGTPLTVTSKGIFGGFGSGTIIRHTIQETINAGDVIAWSYTPGNVQDGAGNTLASASGSVTYGNSTPAAPTINADDAANTIDATHTLGDSEILISINNGSYAQFDGNVISVGNVARAAGYYKFKIKSATGRNESAVASSPAFTVASGGIDSDAQTYITNEESLSSTTLSSGDKTAISDLITTLKSSTNVWANKVLACHLFMGSGTLNAKTPVNDNASKRLIFVGATLAANGLTTDGVDDYVKTNIKASTDFTQDNESYAWIEALNISATGIEFGATDGTNGGTSFWTKDGTNAYMQIQGSTAISIGANSDGSGVYVITRRATSVMRALKGTTEMYLGGLTYSGLTPSETILGAQNADTTGFTPQLYKNCRFGAWIAFNQSLTDAEMLVVSNALTAFKTATSR